MFFFFFRFLHTFPIIVGPGPEPCSFFVAQEQSQTSVGNLTLQSRSSSPRFFSSILDRVCFSNHDPLAKEGMRKNKIKEPLGHSSPPPTKEGMRDGGVEREIAIQIVPEGNWGEALGMYMRASRRRRVEKHFLPLFGRLVSNLAITQKRL